MRESNAVFFIYFVLVFLMFMPATSVASDKDVLDVHVYVVCLDGLGAIGVSNVSKVLQGVLKASSIPRVAYLTGEWKQMGLSYEPVIGEIYVDVHVDVITDWLDYKSLVESSTNVLIVNSHGQNLPVPADYAKEEWIDKIAFAVLYRNVTWVHIAGYPFKDMFHQETGEEIGGEEGFERFMSYIGKENVTCWAPMDEHGESLKDEYCGLTEAANFALATNWLWPNFPLSIKMGNPLNRSYIPDVLVLPLYSRSCKGQDCYSGAIIAFAKPEAKLDFGFYVHLGGGQTFGSHQSSRYFDAGYITGAAAI